MIKLSARLHQKLSLQLNTATALDKGVEDIHIMCSEYADKLEKKEFQKEMRRFFLKNNKKTFFAGIHNNDLLKADPAMMEKVFSYAIERHLREMRDSGFPYLAHVLSTGFLLARLGLPKEIVYSGILHDSVEDTKNKIQVLNDLYAIHPSIAYHVFTVSGPDISDTVEKDRLLLQKILNHSNHSASIFPMLLKVTDGIANLFDIEFMKARDGRTARERQIRFLNKTRDDIIPLARKVDEAHCIPVKKRTEIFSLEEYTRDTLQFKEQLICDD